ncbi:Retrotransposable element Tf2 [Senna tora]|uniref:Retrotransposable element Tf2 n=1 Tax=Senna tora TaxID=362788 RepID=A0A834TKA6_9FABA|nr:Retrotransposable element Tf2 [Senna tora]
MGRSVQIVKSTSLPRGRTYNLSPVGSYNNSSSNNSSKSYNTSGGTGYKGTVSPAQNQGSKTVVGQASINNNKTLPYKRFTAAELKERRSYGGQSVQILIDNGSTHNFVKSSIAEKLKLPLEEIKPFRVQMGSGVYLECQYRCAGMEIIIQNHVFMVDLFVLDLKGSDVVLGVQWLAGLGDIVINHKELRMSFQWGEETVKIQGESLLIPEPINGKGIKRMAMENTLTCLFSLQQVVETEKSTNAVLPGKISQLLGAVLSQNGHPLAYFSKKLTKRLSLASAYVRELYAITQFYLSKLLGFDFEIVYRTGRTNLVDDALSRQEEFSNAEPVQSGLHSMSQVRHSIFSEIREANEKHEELLKLHEQFSDNQLPATFTVKDGVMLYEGRIFIPASEKIKEMILTTFHDSVVGGHSGVTKTYKAIVEFFWWKGMTPYKALYGINPSPLAGNILDNLQVESVEDWLKARDELQERLKINLLKAQAQMKKITDVKRKDKTFEVGDWVWVKLQQYRQKSAAQRLCFKLTRRYYGPFQVNSRVGQVAYRLTLPTSSKIHPVFHVSLLKAFKGDLPKQQGEIPTILEPFTSCPKAIVDQRHVLNGEASKLQVLVEWEGFPREEATWEDWDCLLKAFPYLNLEDKVIVHGRDNDTVLEAQTQIVEPNCHFDAATEAATKRGTIGPSDQGPLNREKRTCKAPAWAKDYVQ